MTNPFLAAMVWRWEDAGALQRIVQGTPPQWIATVPANMDRPSWIPRGAVLHALGGGENCWTWSER